MIERITIEIKLLFVWVSSHLGEKYVVHGILFKFATDHKGIFNGNIEAAMKVLIGDYLFVLLLLIVRWLDMICARSSRSPIFASRTCASP